MKHRKWGGLVVALLLAGYSTVQAQEQKALSIEEAVGLSLKNSNALKGSQARITQATAALREAVDRKLPDASVSGSYLRLNSPNVSLKVKTGTDNGGGGGTTGEEPGKISQAMYGMANVSLPLYAGGRIRYGIESSRYLAEAARLDAAKDREAVTLNTIEAFNNLAKAKAAVALVQENLKDAQQRAADFRKLEQNGLMARNDLLKAELQASNMELTQLDAENNWKLANINMNLLLGLPENTDLNPIIGSLKSPTGLEPIASYVQQGIKNRKDLAALQLRSQAAATGVKAVKGERLPSLALTGGYVDLHVPNLLTVINAVNLGLGVKYDVAALWKNKAKVQSAEARVQELKASEESLNDAIRLQVAQAYQNYLSSQKKIEVYGKAIAQAEENFKIIQNKYNNGLATATDLLDADVARLQTRLNSAFAQSDAAVAYSRLLQAAGILTTQTAN